METTPPSGISTENPELAVDTLPTPLLSIRAVTPAPVAEVFTFPPSVAKEPAQQTHAVSTTTATVVTTMGH